MTLHIYGVSGVSLPDPVVPLPPVSGVPEPESVGGVSGVPDPEPVVVGSGGGVSGVSVPEAVGSGSSEPATGTIQ